MAILIMMLTVGVFSARTYVHAQDGQPAQETAAEAGQETNKTVIESDGTTGKAMAAGIAIGLAALGGAIAMGISIARSNDGIARQPEAAGNIRTLLMLGLVFIETVVIYSLIVAILIIFVL